MNVMSVVFLFPSSSLSILLESTVQYEWQSFELIYNYYLVMNVVKRFTGLQTELGENCNTREMEIVIFDVMAVHLLETAPLLEPLVDCLVPSSRSILCQEVYLRYSISRHTNLRWGAPVAFVGFDLFTSRNEMDKPVAKDLHVGPPTTRIGPIDPNDMASLNADSNFISNAGAFVLVRPPFLVDRLPIGPKVCAIDCCLALLASIAAEAIGPFDLHAEEEGGMRLRKKRNDDVKLTMRPTSTYHERCEIGNRNHDEVNPLPQRLSTLDPGHSTQSSLNGIRLEVKKTPEQVERSGIPRQRSLNPVPNRNARLGSNPKMRSKGPIRLQ